MKTALLFFALIFAESCTAQTELNIVPMPSGRSTITFEKNCRILNNTVVYFNNESISKDVDFFINTIKNETGVTLIKEFSKVDFKTQNQNVSNSAITITVLPAEVEKNLPNDSYTIMSQPNSIFIIVKEGRGLFYSLQTLRQLIITRQQAESTYFEIPAVAINDYPRFLYRGMHLDVARHFFPVFFIKKYIDYLAAYKFNTFHWHLTDDQGWRIEIKKYPELTKAGAWRNGTIIGRYPGTGNDNKPYAGFYTQEEIKEVVQYAKERYIDVIPEIEMPGHSSAAIAAYPWLSCFPAKPTEIPSNMISKKSIEEQKNGRIKLVQETWGVFDDVFCAGKDSTLIFLENVIDEVSKLFPSKYFHLGGDESPKTHWKICPACQKRMKDNKLKDEHELQSWFVQRIEKYVNSKDKILIGWDEILEGGLAPNAVVMSWRGEAGGIEAAKQKHQVIMTPGNPVYFDHTQSQNEDSVTFGGYNPIENVYAYDPIPKELNAEQGKYILGAQANMWTEYMEYPGKVEYQLFPRIAALSEVLWSPKKKRDWKDFERRLPIIFERLDKEKINYSNAYYDLKATVMPTKNLDGVLWKVETKNKNGKIKWTSSYLSSYIGDYSEPLLIKESMERIAMFVSGDNIKQLSSVTQKFSFNKATGKKITIVTEADKKYPGNGAFTLVDGVQNEKGLAKSSEFLGFYGTDLEVTIDLGNEMDVSKVTLHVLKLTGSWIYIPSQVEVTFIPFIDTTIITKHPPLETITVSINPDDDLDKIEIKKEKYCRYIQVKAKNYGIIPAGRVGAGNPAWLFVDEIEVH